VTLTVWRIVTHRFAATSFSGDGARLYGGRWNRKGVSVVYTSGTTSLAMLELMVQDSPLRARYVVIPAVIPDGMDIERLNAGQLPAEWRNTMAREALQEIGSDWVASRRTAVLAMPSAVVPGEHNYLINPRHDAFWRIGIGSAQVLLTDRRLLQY